MIPAAGDLALRLRVTIPRVVKAVGAEDEEELVQEAIVVAAQMLDAVERHGKTGSLAYYAILAMKSGRRGQCRSRADTMAQGTQLDAKKLCSVHGGRGRV